MSSSLCFAPLLHCLRHPQKQQREGTSAEISPIKPCRTHNCSATRSLSASPADQTPAKFHCLTVTGYKCSHLSFPCTPAQLKETGSWKQVRTVPAGELDRALTLWICPSCWQNPSAREAHSGQHLLEAIWSTSP